MNIHHQRLLPVSMLAIWMLSACTPSDTQQQTVSEDTSAVAAERARKGHLVILYCFPPDSANQTSRAAVFPDRIMVNRGDRIYFLAVRTQGAVTLLGKLPEQVDEPAAKETVEDFRIWQRLVSNYTIKRDAVLGEYEFDFDPTACSGVDSLAPPKMIIGGGA